MYVSNPRWEQEKINSIFKYRAWETEQFTYSYKIEYLLSLIPPELFRCSDLENHKFALSRFNNKNANSRI